MLKKYILLTFIGVFFLFNFNLAGQNCGPNCPACSGNISGALLAQNSFLFNGMYIPGGEDENGRLNLRYGLFSWMDIGVGYAISSKTLVWNARVEVFKENNLQD